MSLDHAQTFFDDHGLDARVLNPGHATEALEVTPRIKFPRDYFTPLIDRTETATELIKIFDAFTVLVLRSHTRDLSLTIIEALGFRPDANKRANKTPLARRQHSTLPLHKDGASHEHFPEGNRRLIRVLNNPHPYTVSGQTIVGQNDDVIPFAKRQMATARGKIDQLLEEVDDHIRTVLKNIIEAALKSRDHDHLHYLIEKLGDISSHSAEYWKQYGLAMEPFMKTLIGLDQPEFDNIFYRHTHTPLTSIAFSNWRTLHARVGTTEGPAEEILFSQFSDLNYALDILP